MPEVNIPKNLAKELGEERNNQINSLVNFEEMLKSKLEKDTLSDEMREIIEKKMLLLVEVLDSIHMTANARHMSMGAKKEYIEEDINSFDFNEANDFLKELNSEIDNTKKSLLRKIKNIAIDIKREAEETAERMTKAIQGNIKLVKEGISLSKKEQRSLADRIDVDSLFDTPSENEEKAVTVPVEDSEELDGKEGTKEKNDLAEKFEELKGKKKDKNKRIKRLNKQYDKIEEQMETAMVKYKSEGFIGTFKKLWANRKENHQGFFSILNEALWESYDNKEERTELKEERNILYEKQCEIDKRIKKAERELKELSKQIKDVRKELGISGEKILEKAKATYTNAISSSPEVTAEKLSETRKKINDFGERREEKRNKGIDR